MDVAAQAGNRRILMLGSGGPAREMSQSAGFLKKGRGLPVLLGTGLGHALGELLREYTGPIAVMDKEADLRKLTGAFSDLSPEEMSRLTLMDAPDWAAALKQLTEWQKKYDGQPLVPIALTFYQRIDPGWYGTLRKAIGDLPKPDSDKATHLPHPRILLLAHKYFLIGEIQTACKKIGLEYELVMMPEKEADSESFVRTLLATINRFHPDCCITLNHTGVDMEGVLMHWLARLELPLASWFVDNPHLLIHLYANNKNPWVCIFTFDEDNLPTLKEAGFPHVFYLPLGTDPERFKPHAGTPNPAWRARVSFVGNSMIHKVGARLKAGHFPQVLLRSFHQLSRAFASSEERSVADFMARSFPGLYRKYSELPNIDKKLAWETAVTWKATQIYRNERVMKLLPFEPLIVGDPGWRIVFRHNTPRPRLLPPINYYTQLPVFYGESLINFNCTSRQMKGAVNQRVFDAPAAGGFVLTDWRAQMAGLFEPDEMACYHDLAEIPELVSYYLAHSNARQSILTKARERILACHTWSNRLKSLLEKMSAIYGSKLKTQLG